MSQDLNEVEKLTIKVVLREYLKQSGITVYTLSKWVTGVSPQTVYAVANGTRRPSLDVLESILIALRAHGHNANLDDILQIEADTGV